MSASMRSDRLQQLFEEISRALLRRSRAWLS